MRSFRLSLVFALLATVAAGQEPRPAPAAPQARPKLDPQLRESQASSTWSENRQSIPAESAPVVLERFVVKGRFGEALMVRAKDPLPQGKFSMLRGGSLVGFKSRGSGVFLGVKPWFDVFEDDARFKHPAPSRINFTLFQLSR